MRKLNALSRIPAAAQTCTRRHAGFGWTPYCALACVFLGLACWPAALAAQSPSKFGKLHIGDDGSIYVVFGDGTRIEMAGAHHCSEAQGTEDQRSIACLVAPKNHEHFPYHFLRLEIYRSDGQRLAIEAGAEIREWHFWNHGRQLAVYWQPHSGPRSHVLYDTATAHAGETIADPPDQSQLPQWAKDRAQIEDESVPISPALAEERTRWIAKELRLIQKIRPGMHRSDLSNLFVTEGGLSSRFQRRYVLAECRYIKVDVHFRAAGNKSDEVREDPNDIITSISKPYLEWTIAD